MLLSIYRNRVYGTYSCPECDQTFINTARLERHLAVHQVYYFNDLFEVFLGEKLSHLLEVFYKILRVSGILGQTQEAKN